MTDNATFYTFKISGKWKYEGRGYLSPEAFSVFTLAERRKQILADNGGRVPGTSGPCEDLIIVVIGDESNEHGWPLLLP